MPSSTSQLFPADETIRSRPKAGLEAPALTPRSREDLVNGIFGALDQENCARLDVARLQVFLRLRGCDTDGAELCKSRGWNPTLGVDARQFAELLNTKEGSAYSPDEELRHRFGMACL